MVRKLKHHEQKLLKKVDFAKWGEGELRENLVMRKYFLQDRNDYKKYNIICGKIRKLATDLSLLDLADPFRIEKTMQILDKLFKMGIITKKESLEQCAKVSVSAICRRRLPIVMVRLKMAETVKLAVTYVEQGHVRVGPQVINDPAFLVSRNLEDYVTWVDSSKIREKVLEYNDKKDDFDLLL